MLGTSEVEHPRSPGAISGVVLPFLQTFSLLSPRNRLGHPSAPHPTRPRRPWVRIETAKKSHLANSFGEGGKVTFGLQLV